MTSTTKTPYAGHRFPPELISYTVWLYFRFPLSLRMVEEMLAFRGIEVSHETIRQWGSACCTDIIQTNQCFKMRTVRI
jgi:putative transposase